jgi:hypothetical protein
VLGYAAEQSERLAGTILHAAGTEQVGVDPDDLDSDDEAPAHAVQTVADA